MGRRVVVTGAGAISPVADSAAGLHAALREGRSGLKPLELFPLDGLGPRQAGEIRPFDPRQHLGDRNLRPVDRTSRLLLVAAGQALEAAGWTEERRAASELGLVVGTTFCSVRTIAEFDRRGLSLGPSHASPMDFANSVINAAAGQAAIWFGLRGVNSTISGGEASGLQAIAYAADLIRTGRAEALLAGGVEELCYESFLGYLRASRLASSGSGTDDGERPIPFDARRNGFALAEGAGLLVLEDADSAARRGARVLAEVLGHGEAFALSPREDEMSGAVARAVRLALTDAATAPEEIDCLFASANGSPAGDRCEALGVAAALGARAADLPVAAVKGMLGEALGASGGFQAVALLGALDDGTLPGIPGLEALDEGFPLGGISQKSRRIEVRRALVNAVGSDGHCCAVVLSAPGREG
ncbi:MAG TPA: beta-ketoacyl-[acyl-carrier-protein] synthase family protein [Thermoanaerobaculia bacterium]|nr:beta-ketoacyl-[acyl-carrier-protein] synthase family protein [Thermoanaerobaculia bacterium]